MWWKVALPPTTDTTAIVVDPMANRAWQGSTPEMEVVDQAPIVVDGPVKLVVANADVPEVSF